MHARLLSIDVADALGAPGVLAVYTAADLRAGGLGDPRTVELRERFGLELDPASAPVLAERFNLRLG